MAVSTSRRQVGPIGLPAPFACVVESDRTQVRIMVVGEIDPVTVPQLDAALTEAHTAGCASIELGLSRTTFMDSSGVHLLIDWTRTGARDGTRVTVARCSQPVQRLLELTGTTHLVSA
jgi:anti-anti-sigma factor